MGTTLSLVSSVVEHVVDRYVREMCVMIGADRDGNVIYGCESGIFAKVSNHMNFEYQVGLEWIPSGCRKQFGAWMFYSARMSQVEKLLQDAGINISV